MNLEMLHIVYVKYVTTYLSKFSENALFVCEADGIYICTYVHIINYAFTIRFCQRWALGPSQLARLAFHRPGFAAHCRSRHTSSLPAEGVEMR